MNRKVVFTLVFGVILVMFVVGTAWAIYDQNLVSGSTDIYPTWQGGKLFWEDGISPYDDRVGEKSQQAIYGHPAEPGEDEFQFVYPFYLIVYFGPLSLLEFELAAAIFMEILLILLALSLAMTLDIVRWLPKPITLGMAILFVLLSYFSVRGLLLSQPAFLAYGFHMGAYWALSREQNRLGGICLALSTIKPQTGYLIVPLLLIWAWTNGRRNLVYGFLATFVGLVGVSFILLPTWFAEWLDRVFGYSNYAETFPTAHILTHVIRDLPDLLTNGAQILLSLIILIPVGQFWWRAIIQKQNEDFLWGLMVTMAASLLIAPRVATTYYVELYPSIFVGMLLLERRGHTAWLIGGTLVVIIGYWALHIASAPPREEAGKEAQIVYVVFPTLVYLWLLWRREDWIEMVTRKTHHATAASQ